MKKLLTIVFCSIIAGMIGSASVQAGFTTNPLGSAIGTIVGISTASASCPIYDPDCCKPQAGYLSCDPDGWNRLINSCGSHVSSCQAGYSCVERTPGQASCQPTVACDPNTPLFGCIDPNTATNSCGKTQACGNGYECRTWEGCVPKDSKELWRCNNKSNIDQQFYGRYSARGATQICPGGCNPDGNGDGIQGDAVCKQPPTCPRNSRQYRRCDVNGNIVNGCNEIVEDCTGQGLKCDGEASSCRCIGDPEVDLCLNIDGIQNAVPYGHTRDSNGNCKPVITYPVWKCAQTGWIRQSYKWDSVNYDPSRAYGEGEEVSTSGETPERNKCIRINQKTDVSIIKTADREVVNSGDVVKYTITVTNHGPGIVTSPRTTEIIPDHMRFMGFEKLGGYAGYNIIDKNGFSVLYTKPKDPTFPDKDHVAGYAREVLVDGRWYYRGTYDPDLKGNGDIVCRVLDKDLGSVFQKGETVCYKNNQNDWWNGAGFSIGGHHEGPWGGTTNFRLGQVIAGDQVQWYGGNDILPAGATQTRVIYLQYDGSLGTSDCIDNTAVVGLDNDDTNPNNNTSTKRICVGETPKADVTIKKTSLKKVFPNQTGEIIDWKLEYKNNGPTTANNVSIVDTIPNGLTFAGDYSPTSTVSSIVFSGDKITYTLKNPLQANQTGEILLRTRYVGGKPNGIPLTNIAAIRTDTPETNYNNNADGDDTKPEGEINTIVSCESNATTTTSTTATGGTIRIVCQHKGGTSGKIEIYSGTTLVKTLSGTDIGYMSNNTTFGATAILPRGQYKTQCIVDNVITYKVDTYVYTEGRSCAYKQHKNDASDICAVRPTTAVQSIKLLDVRNVVGELTLHTYCTPTQLNDSNYECKNADPDTTVHVKDDYACQARALVAKAPALGDYVWLDENRNGIQDGVEQGIANITVELYQGCAANASRIRQTTTDNTGRYYFDDLTAGQPYAVRFVRLNSYNFTTQNAGSDDAKDSDASGDGWSHCITLGATEINLDVDAGMYAIMPDKGAIGNRVWLDEDNDGIDNGEGRESGVGGVTVELYACNSTTRITSTTTNGSGYYNFNDLTPGSGYYVKFIKPNLYGFTTYTSGGIETDFNSDAKTDGTTDCITVQAGISRNTVDAGLIQQGPLALGDKLWIDVDKDGIQDDNENGLAGVKVYLYKSCTGTTVFKETTTSSTGRYGFDGLFSGSYRVKFDKPNNYVFTSKDQGSDRAKDSNVDTQGRTECINLQNTDLTIDAGVHTTGGYCPPERIDCGGGGGTLFCGDGYVSSNLRIVTGIGPDDFAKDSSGNFLLEKCDDGNRVDGDGCSSLCQIENNGPKVTTGSIVGGVQCGMIDPPDVMIGEYIPFWWSYDNKQDIVQVPNCGSIVNGNSSKTYVINSLDEYGQHCTFSLENGAGERGQKYVKFCNLKQDFSTSELTRSYLAGASQTVRNSYAGAMGASYIAPNYWFLAGGNQGMFTKLGEYQIVWDEVSYYTCERFETKNASGVVTSVNYERSPHRWTSQNNTTCMMPITVTKPYMTQQNGLSASIEDHKIMADIVDAKGDPIVAGSATSTTHTSYAGSANLAYLVNDFVNKYVRLATSTATSTKGLEAQSIKKVANANIYVAQGNVTFTPGDNNIGSMTIIVPDGNIRVVGNIVGNVMILAPKGNLEIVQPAGQDTWDRPKNQTLQGIYIAKSAQGLTIHNTALANTWKFGGQLRISGLMINLEGGAQAITALKQARRSTLAGWNNVPEAQKQAKRLEIVQNGASLQIQALPSLWTNLPPGANEFMTALETYK